MAENVIIDDIPTKTDEDIALLCSEYEQKEKKHKIVRWGLGIAGAVLLAAAAVTIAPVGLAAFSTAWWAVNGALTSLGLMGIGAAVIARVLDRKNIKILKALRRERQLREDEMDARTKEDLQRKYDKAYNKGKKYMSPEITKVLQKANPEVREVVERQTAPKASENNEGLSR